VTAAADPRQVHAQLARPTPGARAGVDAGAVDGELAGGLSRVDGTGGLLRSAAAVGRQREDEVPLRDGVVHRHRHPVDRAGRRRGDLHGGLLRLEDDQHVLRRDGVAGSDEHLDHRDVLEVAQIGDADLDQRSHGGATSGSMS
jgi:hypothetical protein